MAVRLKYFDNLERHREQGIVVAQDSHYWLCKKTKTGHYTHALDCVHDVTRRDPLPGSY